MKKRFSQLAIILVAGILSMIFGGVFALSQRVNEPISRDEALAYCGVFDCYQVSGKNRSICFEDGTVLYVYPYTENRTFRDKMQTLEKETVLYLLVNPNNNCVIEIKTDTEELMNFEASQKEIDAYDNWYVGIGVAVCLCGLFFIVYGIGGAVYEKRELARQAKNDEDAERPPLRVANPDVKRRILLETSVDGYQICYRRVRRVNELVVNGMVYDEKSGLIEYPHRLSVTLEGHRIEAGLNQAGNSYIRFDGKRIAGKIRWI